MPNLHTANRHHLSTMRRDQITKSADAAAGKVAAASPVLAASKARAAVRAARTRHTAKA
jgi:hypothetical protein